MTHTIHPDELLEGTVVSYGGCVCLLVKQDKFYNKVSGFDDQRQHVRRRGEDGEPMGSTVITTLALDPAYGGHA